MIKLSTLHTNPDNPRQIEKDKFQRLCDSIRRDPEFMELNPLKIDKGGLVLAGNMRYQALVAMEFKEIPENWVEDISFLSAEKKRRYVMIDNISFGFWDWDIVTGQYTEDELTEWGLDLPVEPIPEAEEDPPPISHSFKIKCEDLDELIELRDLLNAEVDSKSMSYANFKMIFEHRID